MMDGDNRLPSESSYRPVDVSAQTSVSVVSVSPDGSVTPEASRVEASDRAAFPDNGVEK
jgi:hypothetical protein